MNLFGEVEGILFIRRFSSYRCCIFLFLLYIRYSEILTPLLYILFYVLHCTNAYCHNVGLCFLVLKIKPCRQNFVSRNGYGVLFCPFVLYNGSDQLIWQSLLYSCNRVLRVNCYAWSSFFFLAISSWQIAPFLFWQFV